MAQDVAEVMRVNYTPINVGGSYTPINVGGSN